MLTLILAVLGGAAGYFLAPRYVPSVPQIPATIVGVVLGLIIGRFFGSIMGLVIPMLIGVALYLAYTKHKAGGFKR